MKSPLFEHRHSERAVLNPEDLIIHIEDITGRKRPRLPKCAVFTFWRKMPEEVGKVYGGRISTFLGEPFPFRTFKYKGVGMTFMLLPFGAPPSGALVDAMFSLGTEYAIFLGTCGVLDSAIERNRIIVPTKALRDEGTSYHYERPSRFSYPSRRVLDQIERTLKANEMVYQKGATWTTDAFFRETPRNVRGRLKEGCVAVEMEAAALFSIARFRKKHIGAMFCAGDCVGGSQWDPRKTRKDIGKDRESEKRALELSLETLRSIHQES